MQFRFPSVAKAQAQNGPGPECWADLLTNHPCRLSTGSKKKFQNTWESRCPPAPQSHQ